MPLALFRWAYHAHLAVPLNHALFVRHNGREGHINCRVQDGAKLFSYYDRNYGWLKESSEAYRFTFRDDQTKETIPFRFLYDTVDSKTKGFPAGLEEPIRFTIVDLLTEVDSIECLKEKGPTASELRLWATEVLTLFVDWYRALNSDPSVPLPRLEESPVVEIWVGEKTELGEIGAELEPYARHFSWPNPIKTGVSKRNLSEEGIQTLAHALELGRELPLYQRLLLEARELAYLNYNYALSIVVAGTAFEVLVAQELQTACERKHVTKLPVSSKPLRMQDYRKAIRDGRLNRELLGAFPKALCGVSLKTLPEYPVWVRDAYEPRNWIIHGGSRQADEVAARKAFEAVTAFAGAISSALSKEQEMIYNSAREQKDSSRSRIIYEGQCFSRQVIQLDGNEYKDCKFEACTLIYSGGQLPILASNSFNNCLWHFDGAAERTIQFMTALYHGGATDLIEKSFENIRRGGL